MIQDRPTSAGSGPTSEPPLGPGERVRVRGKSGTVREAYPHNFVVVDLDDNGKVGLPANEVRLSRRRRKQR